MGEATHSHCGAAERIPTLHAQPASNKSPVRMPRHGWQADIRKIGVIVFYAINRSWVHKRWQSQIIIIMSVMKSVLLISLLKFVA